MNRSIAPEALEQSVPVTWQQANPEAWDSLLDYLADQIAEQWLQEQGVYERP
jgi:hypothetical protein